jgi:hypothetical protein
MKRQNVSGSMECLQIGFNTVTSSANRVVETEGLLPWSRVSGEYFYPIEVELNPFLHRTWFHLCWTYSSITRVHGIYYNGNLVKNINITCKQKHRPTIDASINLKEHAFIVGQEQDKINGSYDKSQIFNGKMTELNIWGHVITDQMIFKMANCQKFPRGDVVSWNQKYFRWNKVKIEEVTQMTFLCKKEKQIIVFPQKKYRKEATSICEKHGGSLIVPNSEIENTEIINLIKPYKHCCSLQSSCNITNKQMKETWDYSCNVDEPVAWLGLRKFNSTWYEQNGRNERVRNISYAPWKKGPGYGNMKCVILLISGHWDYASDLECDGIVHKLCPICKIIGTPTFTIKGLDYNYPVINDWVDWNYYLHTGNSNEVQYFEGYKNTKIIPHNGTWLIQEKNGEVPERIELRDLQNDPVGRNVWKAYYSNNMFNEKSLSLSSCHYNDEFTCNTGQCIPQLSRCNHVIDCDDGSDEEECLLVDIPGPYQLSMAPKLDQETKSKISIITRVNILSIDSIETSEMVVGLTLKISIRWIDPRLTYSNLKSIGNKTVVQDRISDRLWLPLRNILFQNSVVGSLFIDPQKDVIINIGAATMPQNPTKRHKCNKRKPNHQTWQNYETFNDGIVDSYEDLIYHGSNNELEMNQIFMLKYKCLFDHFTFPFDSANCKFQMKLKREEKLTTQFVEEPEHPVIYLGPTNVHQFKIGTISANTSINMNETTFIFYIPMSRNFTHQLLSTFFPTLLLCFLSYSTLFIDLDRFTMRFQGAVIALLVYESLLDPITRSTPETAFFKMIDIWFLWHTVAMFIIILFHILIHKFSHHYHPGNQ